METPSLRTLICLATCSQIGLPAMSRAQTWFPIQDDPRQEVAFATPRALYAFPFDRVRMGEGPVHPYLTSDSAWLLSLDPDKFMSPYLAGAGLPKLRDNYIATGAPTAGHYLSAMALFHATTGNPEFKTRVDHMVSEFARVQKAHGTGILGPESNGYWDEIAAGKIDAQRYKFTLNGIMVPWYTYHKSLAGLLDAYLWTGNAQALEVAKGVGDWICAKFANLTEAKFQSMLECEYGGMEEVLENLHLATGSVKYRDAAMRFRHKSVMDPVSAGIDNLTHLHSNTTLPKYLAAARRAETSVDPGEWTASLTSWNSIYDGRTYAMGGTSSWESWQVDKGGFPLIDWGGDKRRGPETCISYNQLKMGVHMASTDGGAWIAHDMEHTFWNHILSAWNPDNHGMIYYTPVYPGESKGFHNRDDWFPCCKSSAMESHARHASFVWMHDGRNLVVDQFIASTLDWKEKGYKVSLEGRFPETDTIRIRFATAAPAAFSVKVRMPTWCAKASVRINGAAQAVAVDASGRLPVARTWADGDVLEVVFPQTLRIETKPDDKGTVSVFHGPILLAAIIPPGDTAPVFVGSRTRPQDWIHPVAGTRDWWTRSATGRIVTLRPFYRVREERYAIYSANFDGAGVDGIHEAERAQVTDAKLYTSASASAGGYAGGIDKPTSKVVFGIQSLREASARIVVRYANGTSAPSTHRLSCGTWTGTVTYAPTGAWANWDSVVVTVPLALGANLLTFAKRDGYAELDRIRREFAPWPEELPSTWEAEAAVATRVRIDTGIAAASGRSVVGGIDHADSRLVFPGIEIPKRQTCTFRLLYSNATTGTAHHRVSSGNTTVLVPLPSTGGWNKYDSATFRIDLPEGANELAVSREDGYAQLDALRLVAARDVQTESVKSGQGGLAMSWRAGGSVHAPGWVAGATLEAFDGSGRLREKAVFAAVPDGARAVLPASTGGLRCWRIRMDGRVVATGMVVLASRE